MGLAYLGLADVHYYNTKKYAEAAAAYKEGVRLQPDNVSALYNLGWCYNDLERYPDAIAELRKAISLRPNYAEAYNEMGYALAPVEPVCRSRRQRINQPSSNKTDYASAHYNLGVSYIALRNRNGGARAVSNPAAHRRCPGH